MLVDTGINSFKKVCGVGVKWYGFAAGQRGGMRFWNGIACVGSVVFVCVRGADSQGRAGKSFFFSARGESVCAPGWKTPPYGWGGRVFFYMRLLGLHYFLETGLYNL